MLSKIFGVSINELINNYESDPQFYKETFLSEGEMKKSYYLRKGVLRIKLGTFTINKESSNSRLEGLFSLLNEYFNILLSDQSEPLTISIPTSFKTFLS